MADFLSSLVLYKECVLVLSIFNQKYVFFSETFFGPLTGNNAVTSTGGRANRQRNFDTLSPTAHYANICGRRFVRQREARIVGGGVAAYGEWPWQVRLTDPGRGQSYES